MSMSEHISEQDIVRADIYRKWVNGWAYIPIQDLPIYEHSFEKVNRNGR